MMKLVNRFLIIAVMVFGVWFIVRHWDSVEMPASENQSDIIFDEETDSTLSFEDQLEALKTEPLRIHVEEARDIIPQETQPVSTTAPIVLVPVAEVTNIVTVTPPAAALANSTVKVYLFDGGLDLSIFTVPAGHVTFTVRNDGRVSHDFSVEGIADFGRITPGSSHTFELDFTPGEYVLYSPRVLDQQLNMRETLRVENVQ